jgi:Uma2 family endonuclease
MQTSLKTAHTDETVYSPLAVDDPFYYGSRRITETLPDGKTIYRDIPLTQADFLNPQEGDQMVQSDRHFALVKSLHERFHKRYLYDATVGVFSDVKMLWGIDDLAEPAPDLAVVPNLRSKDEYHSSFDVRKEGTRPCLIVEVVSPRYPGDETDKVAIYAQAGVREYIILNPHFETHNLPFTLQGYRLVDGHYQPMQPDAQGRLFSETTDVRFAISGSGYSLILTDAATGEQLLNDEEEYEARLVAEARAFAAEAEVARLKALLAKRSTNGA